MNKNAVLLQVYYWACEHDIPDVEIQDFIADLGFTAADLNDISLNNHTDSQKGLQPPVSAAFN